MPLSNKMLADKTDTILGRCRKCWKLPTRLLLPVFQEGSKKFPTLVDDFCLKSWVLTGFSPTVEKIFIWRTFSTIKIKNRLRIFEGHFRWIFKNHKAQVWVMWFLFKKKTVQLHFLYNYFIRNLAPRLQNRPKKIRNLGLHSIS